MHSRLFSATSDSPLRGWAQDSAPDPLLSPSNSLTIRTKAVKGKGTSERGKKVSSGTKTWGDERLIKTQDTLFPEIGEAGGTPLIRVQIRTRTSLATLIAQHRQPMISASASSLSGSKQSFWRQRPQSRTLYSARSAGSMKVEGRRVLKIVGTNISVKAGKTGISLL